MTPASPDHYVAFEGHQCIARGALEQVAAAVLQAAPTSTAPVLAFDTSTGKPVDVDFREAPKDVAAWARGWEAEHAETRDEAPSPPEHRGRGRPRLGVVSKEVTLLPRHWAWLAAQPGSVSSTLRRLVESARKADEGRLRVRRSQDAAFRFMSALAGDLPGYEEAVRALFSAQAERFDAEVAGWPEDVRSVSRTLASPALTPQTGDSAGEGN